MSFGDRIRSFFGRAVANDALFDELADLLVEGDVGAQLAYEISDELKERCGRSAISDPQAIRRELKSLLLGRGRELLLTPEPGRLNIYLVLGVNGVGKTTTCAKLAHYYGKSGFAEPSILAAADTFRAAAVDQLRIHGERLGIRVVAQGQGADPGAVLWDALDAARADGAGLVIADTAGRMHTRNDLVRELAKIDKVVSARAPEAVYRRLLVLDSTTGQNALRQAESFGNAVQLDAAILTKQDSSAKGGMALALAKERNLPIAFIGTGEGYDDISPFSLDTFVDGFLGL
ncbi:MAG TPA: signal recognition particle-docking protein FtsY [Rectinemataceae bacterium]|nr:signal recognition particle-docking protein FtsY [Rectinemataceae bacterium]